MRSYFKRRTISIERYADFLLFLFLNFFCNKRKWMDTLMDRIANPVFTDNFSHMQEYMDRSLKDKSVFFKCFKLLVIEIDILILK